MEFKRHHFFPVTVHQGLLLKEPQAVTDLCDVILAH